MYDLKRCPVCGGAAMVIQEYLLQQAASYEAWMLETEKAEEG